MPFLSGSTTSAKTSAFADDTPRLNEFRVPYAVADDPATTPSMVVTRVDYCSTAEGVEHASGPARTCGTPVDGAAVLLSGAFERRGELSERLLQALPAALVAPAEDSTYPLVEMVAEEVAGDRPGQQLVLDRMLDRMLVSALRSWFDNPNANAPAWCRALDDPVVGTALRLLHDTPARPWTVADLVAEVRVSRAALARRFTALVGEPPMAYLASWRITWPRTCCGRPTTRWARSRGRWATPTPSR